MSEFKFVCPFCKQHIACDTQHRGRTISCPTCKESIQIPMRTAVESTATTPERAARPLPKALAQTQKLARPRRSASGSTPGQSSKRVPRTSRDTRKKSGVSPEEVRTHSELPPQSVQGLCPVCQALLAVDTQRPGKAKTAPQPVQTFRLIRQATSSRDPAGSAKKKAAGGGPAEPHKGSTTSPPEASSSSPERKAARARGSGGMKPRMDYVLTGKRPKNSPR